MIPVLDAKAMRAADAAAIAAGTPSSLLMENAGVAIAETIAARFPGWRRVAVLCGPGNNGGDGLVAARWLASNGIAAAVHTLREPGEYRGDPAENLARLRAAGVEARGLGGGAAAIARALSDADGVVDALFGTGLSRPLEAAARRLVEAVNRSGRAVVAADIPSGLPDDGRVFGPAIRAALTVALGAPKPCHVLSPASGHCGRLVVADIGIARRLLERKVPALFLAEAVDAAAPLEPRPLDTNKADFGRVAVIAGSRGKAGAAILAARGALRGGAGLVTVFCPASAAPLVTVALPEAMTHPLSESDGAVDGADAPQLLRALAGFDAAVLGPGLGTAAATVAFVETLVRSLRVPLVVDADALNAFAGRPARLARRKAPAVLTPHPGEAARLLGRTSAAIQARRLESVRELARRTRAVAVLKGHRTLVAEGREVSANPTGTPLLATAGSGDVLSGLLGALLAGGLAPRAAAITAVWMHGAAGEALETRLGDAGLLAHEIADALPAVRRALLAARNVHA